MLKTYFFQRNALFNGKLIINPSWQNIYDF